MCYIDLSETLRVINPYLVACGVSGERTLPEEKTLLIPFGWRAGAEGSRSVTVWIKLGKSTCKGAVVRRSPC